MFSARANKEVGAQDVGNILPRALRAELPENKGRSYPLEENRIEEPNACGYEIVDVHSDAASIKGDYNIPSYVEEHVKQLIKPRCTGKAVIENIRKEMAQMGIE